jgi:hypothetical protein
MQKSRFAYVLEGKIAFFAYVLEENYTIFAYVLEEWTIFVAEFQ